MGMFSFFSSEPTVDQKNEKFTMPYILISAGINPKLYTDYSTAMEESRFEDALRLAKEIDHFVSTSARLSYHDRSNEAQKYTQIARLQLAEQKQKNGEYVTAYKLYYECLLNCTTRFDNYDFSNSSIIETILRNIGLHFDVEIAALINSLESMQLQEANLYDAEQVIAKLTDIVAVYRPAEPQFSQYKLWQSKIASLKALQGLNSKANDLAANLSLKKFTQDKHVLRRYSVELEDIVKKYEGFDNLNAISLDKLHACSEKLTKIKTILFIHEVIQHQQQMLAAIDEFDLSRAQKHLQNSINAFSEFSPDQINDIAKEFNLAKKQNLSRKSFVLALNKLQVAMDNIKDLQPKRDLSESVLQRIKDKVVAHLNKGKLNTTELDLTINGFDQEVMTIIDKDFYKLVLLTDLELDIYINGLANIFVDNVTELSTLERYRYWTNAGVKISAEPKVLRELQTFTKDFTTTQVEAQAKQIRTDVLAALATQDLVSTVELTPAPVLIPPPVDTLIFSKPEIEAPAAEPEPELTPREHALQKRH